MKKTLPVILTLVFLLSFPVFAAGGRLTVPSVSGTPGSRVTVKLQLENPGIIATRIFVRYDPQTLRLESAENGDVFDAQYAEFGADKSAVPYTLIWMDSLRTSNVTKSGTLCTLTFTILQTDKAETPIRFAVDKASTFDVNLNEVTVADSSCTVKITQTGTPAGTTSGTTIAPGNTTKATTAAPGTTASTTGKPVSPITQSDATTGAKATTTGSAKPATTGGSTTAPAGETAASTSGSSTTASATPASGKPADETFTETGEPAGVTIAGDETTGFSDTEETTESKPVEDADASDVLTTGTEETSPARASRLLWLLVLVPIAAVAVLLLVKAKRKDSV